MQCIILRGIQSAGKSTFAQFLLEQDPQNTVICSADHYFVDDKGNYNWDRTKLGDAHQWCQTLFETALTNRVKTVIVDNTNILHSEMREYIKMSAEYGYKTTILTVGLVNKDMAQEYYERSRHNVPLEQIQRSIERFQK